MRVVVSFTNSSFLLWYYYYLTQRLELKMTKIFSHLKLINTFKKYQKLEINIVYFCQIFRITTLVFGIQSFKNAQAKLLIKPTSKIIILSKGFINPKDVTECFHENCLFLEHHLTLLLILMNFDCQYFAVWMNKN